MSLYITRVLGTRIPKFECWIILFNNHKYKKPNILGRLLSMRWFVYILTLYTSDRAHNTLKTRFWDDPTTNKKMCEFKFRVAKICVRVVRYNIYIVKPNETRTQPTVYKHTHTHTQHEGRQERGTWMSRETRQQQFARAGGTHNVVEVLSPLNPKKPPPPPQPPKPKNRRRHPNTHTHKPKPALYIHI